MSLVYIALGTIIPFPIVASTSVPSDRLSTPSGCAKLEASCAIGWQQNRSVAVHADITPQSSCSHAGSCPAASATTIKNAAVHSRAQHFEVLRYILTANITPHQDTRAGDTPGTEAIAAGSRLSLAVNVPQSTCGTVMMPTTAINACHTRHIREFLARRSVRRAQNTSAERQNAATSAVGRCAGRKPAAATYATYNLFVCCSGVMYTVQLQPCRDG